MAKINEAFAGAGWAVRGLDEENMHTARGWPSAKSVSGLGQFLTSVVAFSAGGAGYPFVLCFTWQFIR